MAEKITDKIRDMVGEAVSNSGTANTSTAINLNGALTSHQTFATAFGTSSTDTVPEVPITLKEGDNYQTGVATFTHGSPSTVQFSRIDKGGTGISFTSAAEIRLSAIAKRVAGGISRNSQTITGTAPTVAVNTMHYLTIAGITTANKNFTVPAGQAGDWIGLHIVDGDDDYAIVIIGDAGVTLNGGSAATELTRLFIKNENMILRCTATNTWIVEHDGRIPCRAIAAQNADITTNTAGVVTNIPLDVETLDIGSILDHTSNKRINIRRNGIYVFSVQFDILNNESSYVMITGVLNGSTYLNRQRAGIPTTTAYAPLSATGVVSLSASDYLQANFMTGGSNAGSQATGFGFSIVEILT